MNSKDIETAKEFVSNFLTSYRIYSKKLDELKDRLYNVETGIPELKGYRVLSGAEKKSRIATLNSLINTYTENQQKLRAIVNSMDSANMDMEMLAQEEALSKLLKSIVVDRTELNKDGLPKSYDNESKIVKKFYYKSYDAINNTVAKINKSMYKTLKKNQRVRLPHEETIKQRFDLSKFNMEDFFTKLYKEQTSEYYLNPDKLGISKRELNSLVSAFNGDIDKENICPEAEDTYKRYSEIKAYNSFLYNIPGSSELRGIEAEYNEVLKQAREIWFLDKIVKMFGATRISDSDIYKEIVKMAEELSVDLRKNIEKVDKKYDKLNMDKIIMDASNYREMVRNLKNLDEQIMEKIRSGNTIEAENLKVEYNELLDKITLMVKENPGLYKPIFDPYGSVRKNIEENVKREIGNEKIGNENSNNIKQQEKNIDIANLELDVMLHTIRSSHYQNYLVEKVKRSHLGKIPFSSYLERVAPEQTELIEIEKQREKMANNIYKEYLKYYASLEDKKYAMNFEEFASKRYSMDNVDVPIEHEEEYKGMRL